MTTSEAKLASRRRNLTQVHRNNEQNDKTNKQFANHSNVVDESGCGYIKQRYQRPQLELRISFKSLAVTTATAQISSLVFCLAWSVKFNFYESTATHCRVANYLPSLSATLDFTPQRDVWRSCIGLSGVPRYFIAYLYYRIIFRSAPLLWLHWIEITALIGLSIVDSIRYFGKCLPLSWTLIIVDHRQLSLIANYLSTNKPVFHATCVGVFLITSIIHMMLVCNDYVKPSKLSNISETTRRKLSETKIFKKRIAIVNFTTIVTALYLYDRHNRYCEPGVYSAFSFLEYIVIVANIIYHLQAYYDLGDYSILVARLEHSSPDLNTASCDQKETLSLSTNELHLIENKHYS